MASFYHGYDQYGDVKEWGPEGLTINNLHSALSWVEESLTRMLKEQSAAAKLNGLTVLFNDDCKPADRPILLGYKVMVEKKDA
jgi:hypothetical protein